MFRASGESHGSNGWDLLKKRFANMSVMSGECHTAFKSHVMHNVYRLWLLTSFIQRFGQCLCCYSMLYVSIFCLEREMHIYSWFDGWRWFEWQMVYKSDQICLSLHDLSSDWCHSVQKPAALFTLCSTMMHNLDQFLELLACDGLHCVRSLCLEFVVCSFRGGVTEQWVTLQVKMQVLVNIIHCS